MYSVFKYCVYTGKQTLVSSGYASMSDAAQAMAAQSGACNPGEFMRVGVTPGTDECDLTLDIEHIQLETNGGDPYNYKGRFIDWRRLDF